MDLLNTWNLYLGPNTV